MLPPHAPHRFPLIWAERGESASLLWFLRPLIIFGLITYPPHQMVKVFVGPALWVNEDGNDAFTIISRLLTSNEAMSLNASQPTCVIFIISRPRHCKLCPKHHHHSLSDMFVKSFLLRHIIPEVFLLFHQCCPPSAELYLAGSNMQLLLMYELQTDPVSLWLDEMIVSVGIVSE